MDFRPNPWKSRGLLMTTLGKDLDMPRQRSSCNSSGRSMALQSSSVRVRATSGYTSFFATNISIDSQAWVLGRGLLRSWSAQLQLMLVSVSIAFALLPSGASQIPKISAASNGSFCGRAIRLPEAKRTVILWVLDAAGGAYRTIVCLSSR
eukprot:scaffold7138_cov69-Attheya_sp.AAC.7